MRYLAALVAARYLAGCNSTPEDEPSEAKVIRDWTRALNQEHYGEAASFFVDGAIVEQVREFRLARTGSSSSGDSSASRTPRPAR